MWATWALALIVAISATNGQDLGKQVCSADKTMLDVGYNSANVVFGASLSVRNPGTGGVGCGSISGVSMQIVEGLKYSIDYLNKLNNGQGFLPGIKFGMKLYDSCSSSINAIRNVQKLYPQTTSYQPYCANVSPQKVNLGMIGPFYSNMAEPVANYAKEIPLTLISPSAMSAKLSDKNKYPTFYRTVPSIAEQFLPIAMLLDNLSWKKTIVLHMDDAYGMGGYHQMLEVSRSFDICVSHSVSLPSAGGVDDFRNILARVGTNSFVGGVISASASQAKLILEALNQVPELRKVHWILIDVDLAAPINPTLMKGAFAVMPKMPTVEAFRDYFVTLEENPAQIQANPWFREWYETEYKCSLATNAPNRCSQQNRNTLLNNFKMYPYVVPTIKAVLAYAEAFKQLCNQNGLCNNALNASPQQIQNILRSMDVDAIVSNTALGKIKFDSNGDVLGSDFAVYQYNDVGSGSFSFKEVGVYQNGALNLPGSLKFYQEDRVTALNQIPLLTCGVAGCSNCIFPPQRVNFQYNAGDVVVASLVNAHMYSNSLFTCGAYSAKQLASLVAVQWAVNDYKQDTSKLRGVSVGTLVADVCPTGAVAAGFLNQLLGSNREMTDSSGRSVPSQRNIFGFVDDTDNPIATYISNLLSHYKVPEIQAGASMKNMDDTFISKIVPTMDMYMKALTSLLVAKQWKHVKVVTMKNTKYAQMVMRFKAYAAGQGICIVSMSDFNDGASNVLNQILSNTNSFVVITFGPATNVKELFNQIKVTGNKGNIQIISGMAEWGTDPSYFDVTTSEPEFAITFGLGRQVDAAFQNYLQGLSQSQILSNHFLTQLFEMTNKCSLTVSSRTMYTRVCSSTETFNPYQGTAPYVIRGIRNMLNKLDEIITEVCGSNYNGLCVDFQRLSDVPQRLAQKLRNSVDIVNGESTTNIVYYVVRNGLYQQIGTFSPLTQTFSFTQNANNNLLNPNFNRGTTCPSACVECQYLYTYRDIMYTPGDFIIAGSFGASSQGPAGLQPYLCGDSPMASGSVMSAAMLYALNQVNSKQAPVSVKGLTFGGLALDHCNTVGRQQLMVSDIYSGFLHPKMKVNQNKIISWVTSGSQSSQETASLLNPLGVAMVSPDASDESLLQKYNNFYRTIQGDGTIANAFVKLTKQLGFPFLQVVFDSSSMEAKDTLVNSAQAEGICVTQAVAMDDVSQTNQVISQLMQKETNVVVVLVPVAKGNKLFEEISKNEAARTSMVIITPQSYKSAVEAYGRSMTYPPLALQFESSSLTKFKAYLNSNPVDNVFFARYYMRVFQCNLDGYNLYDNKCSLPLSPITQSAQFVDSVFDLSTINAVYATVDAMDRTIKEYCGADYQAPCAAFLQAPDQRQRFVKNLQFVSFIDEGLSTFRFLQKEGNVAFDLLQYHSTRNVQVKVGSYAGVSLVLDSNFLNNYKNVKSDCSQPCLECINRGLNFSITPGDIYLGGVFDVHQPSYNPFICGRINTLHGFLLLEAFHYALEQVNAKDGQFKNILNGVKLGGIGLDACSSRVRGGQLVSNINNNLTPITKGGTTVDASQIDVYIGSYNSDSSRYLARILTDLEIPQISYAASSSDLSDHRIYPYFFRTVPSNIHQARAILAYLNENNIRYIQVLYFGNNYGETGRDELVKLAAEYKICVAQAVEYPDLGIATLEASRSVVSKLMEKPSANTVVTFLGTSAINSVLRAIGFSDRARNKLRFVGSDVWADNTEAIDGAEAYAVDSVTLKLDADDVSEFESFINSKTLANSADNPWFEEYYQEIHNCYTSPGNPYGFARPCPQSLSSIISSRRYQQDPNVINVINSVYASAYAIHKTLTELCGVGYQSVCQAYRNNDDRRLLINDNLEDVNFTDPSGTHFEFTDKEVKLNFRLNAIVTGDLQGVIYKQFGTYNSNSMTLNLTSKYTPSRPWHSDCDREDACSECPAIRDSITRYTFYPQTLQPNPDKPIIVAFFDIHKQGIDPYRCGQLNMAGYQQFLAFLQSVDSFNRETNTGIRVLAIDTCSNPVRLDQDLFGLLQGTGICNTQFITPNGATISASSISSIVVSGSKNTMAASRLLEQLGITYISPNARSPLLDNKMNLARSVAPISADMKYLAALFKQMGWDYMDVMYEETAEGYYRWHSLRYWASFSRVCVGSQLAVGVGTNDQDLGPLLEQLNGRRGSSVVVLLGSKQYFKRVLSQAGEDVVQAYVWILGSDEHIDKQFIKDISPVGKTVRIISLYSPSYSVGNFRDMVSNFRYSTSTGAVGGKGPVEWQEEFIQMMNECTIPTASKVLNKGKPNCANAVNMDNFLQDPYVLNTMAAGYAASRGLDALGRRNKASIADADRTVIRSSVLAAVKEFSTNSGTVDFRFNEHRWWDTPYVVNYWSFNGQDVVQLNLNQDDVTVPLKARLNTTSVCKETVKQGFCGCTVGDASSSPLVNLPDFVPASHRNYYKYDSTGDRQFDIPVWAVVVSILTGIGLFVTIVLFFVLVCAYPKKGGTSILGYMMIIGVIGIYAINFAFFFSATDEICGIRRFLMGVVYATCFAPLLIKAVDNWRFGDMDYDERQYSGISSSCCLLLSAIALVLIQCIIPIMWLILEHPRAQTWAYTDLLHDNDWCSPPDDYDLGLVLSFSFVGLLVLITAIFAALSYHTRSNNFESRWIMFASVATAGCFLVWMIVTTNASGIYRDPTVAIANFVNATILLLVIPLRKTVLMLQNKRNNGEDTTDKNPYDTYSEAYGNPGYELSYYD